MPFASEAQRRLIYAAASRGEQWAKDFICHSGHTPPRKARRARHLKRTG